ncbi:MAG TPA: hypothetical protein VH300_15205 [Thermoleophilaceae bacterium]|nr:hypothetical protein [Thermoleophilaceae bacterium]
MRDGRMHQTTVRFGPDLWEAVEAECSRLGISAAQYVREASVARLAFTAGRTAGSEYEVALAVAGAVEPPGATYALPHRGWPVESGTAAAPLPFDTESSVHSRAAESIQGSSEQRLASSALGAQSQLVLRRAKEIRDQSRRLRAAGRGRRG